MGIAFEPVDARPPASGVYWVYILQSFDRELYVGQTNHVAERLRKHRLGLGSKHTRDHPGITLVFTEGPYERNEAIGREAQLKRWSRAKKEALIRADTAELKRLAKSRETSSSLL